jgi:Ala-tRNA(Pro) deacylase
MDDSEQRVYEALEALGIPWTRYEHPPVFTVEEAEPHWRDIDATHCKNLFLRNKSGRMHYLLIAERSAALDLKRLSQTVGGGRLSFGSPERLRDCLGLTPGSVSPFGLIHGRGRRDLQVLLDSRVNDAAQVTFHPNVNTATIRLSRDDFRRFLDWTGLRVHVVRI